jgi:hypothetical protein
MPEPQLTALPISRLWTSEIPLLFERNHLKGRGVPWPVYAKEELQSLLVLAAVSAASTR